MKKEIILMLNIIALALTVGAQSPISGTQESVKCTLKIGKQEFTPALNSMGYFERISAIKASSNIEISLYYPEGKEGETVLLSVTDGGSFENHKSVIKLKLNKMKVAKCNYTVAADEGLYHIIVNKNNNENVIRFWVNGKTVEN